MHIIPDIKESNTFFIYPKSIRKLNAFFCIFSFFICLFCWFFLEGVVFFYSWFDFFPFLKGNLEALVENGYEDVALSYLVMFFSQIFLGFVFVFVFFNSHKFKDDICKSLVGYKKRVFLYWGKSRAWMAYVATVTFFPIVSVLAFILHGEIDFSQDESYSITKNILHRNFWSFYIFGFFIYIQFYVLTIYGYLFWVLIKRRECFFYN